MYQLKIIQDGYKGVKMDAFYNAIRQEVEVVKGDSLAFNFQLTGLNGSEPSNFYFTCREKPESTDYYFQRTLGDGITKLAYDANTDTVTYGVRVRPDQTDALTAGRYYYDLQLDINDDVITLMKGRFIVDWDVTRG